MQIFELIKSKSTIAVKKLSTFNIVFNIKVEPCFHCFNDLFLMWVKQSEL